MMNYFSKMTNKDLFWLFVSVLFGFVISYLLMRPYIVNPNGSMYAIGGDAWTIYYNFSYHICHGIGSHLEAMAYPTGEYIYLTDAEGAFATLFQWISHHIIDLCPYSVGLIHGLNISFLVLAFMVMYFLLRALGVSNILSAFFGPLVILLSPQMLRFGGHFGLAYPFLIPLTMLWIIRKTKVGVFEKRDVLFGLTLLFFTFNNPYLGFSAAAIGIASSLFWFISNRKNYKTALLLFAIPALAIAIVFLNFKFNDPYSDRINLQWGFFYFNSELKGYLYPQGSLLGNLIKGLFEKPPSVEFEAMQNIGLASVLLWLFWFIYKVKNLKKPTLPLIFKIFLGASILIFLYSSAIIFSPFPRDWVENVLGFLLMFKASARLSWSLYFVLSIGGVLILNYWYNAIQNKIGKFFLVGIFFSLWIIELKSYIFPRFDHPAYENQFSISKNSEIQSILDQYHIDKSQYQAILALPKMMLTSDKFMSQLHWNTQYFSMRYSLVSGIPMISEILSRTPVSVSIRGIGLLSNPLIKKPFVNELDPKRNILIVLGKDHSLGDGEKYLLQQSDTIYDEKNYMLLSLKPQDINDTLSINYAKSQYLNHPIDSRNYIYNGFDNEGSDIVRYGNGARIFDKGKHIVLDTILPFSDTLELEFSCWTHIDNKKYSIGDWTLIVLDEQNKEKASYFISTRDSADIQGNWIRSNHRFHFKKGDRIRAIFNGKQSFIIDDLLLRPVDNEVIISDDSNDSFLYNGYLIEK